MTQINYIQLLNWYNQLLNESKDHKYNIPSKTKLDAKIEIMGEIIEIIKKEGFENNYTEENMEDFMNDIELEKAIEEKIKGFHYKEIHPEQKFPNFDWINKLPMVDSNGYLTGEIIDLKNLNSPIVFPGYIPDAQLEVMYQEAMAYIFPSLYEGFGLPPLEAMAKGCPVISSDRASLPEVLGDAAIYFNPEDISDLISKIEVILEDDSIRGKMKDRGYEQVKKYNWWECANDTLEIYKEALIK
ncbi:MAG: glycosyltransferase family 4 protein [bacterium]